MPTTKSYVVNCAKLPFVVGSNPITGIDRVESANRGEQVQMDPNDRHTQVLLRKKYIRPEGEMSDADAAKAAEEQKAAENKTNKQKLQDKAAELGLGFEDKTTVPQLEAMIAEKEEQLRDAQRDQTGATGPDPDKATK